LCSGSNPGSKFSAWQIANPPGTFAHRGLCRPRERNESRRKGTALQAAEKCFNSRLSSLGGGFLVLLWSRSAPKCIFSLQGRVCFGGDTFPPAVARAIPCDRSFQKKNELKALNAPSPRAGLGLFRHTGLALRGFLEPQVRNKRNKRTKRNKSVFVAFPEVRLQPFP
jgi:hypothetical protein